MAELSVNATIGDLRRRAANRLREAFGRHERGELAGLDARLIIAYVLGCEPGDLLTRDDQPVTVEVEQALWGLVERRAAGTPVARLLGRKEFYGLDLLISEETLVPRPDTESVVDAALAAAEARGWRDKPLRILDLGTGAGGLLLALLSELVQARGIGIDVSADAVATARRNATRLDLQERARFDVGDWAGNVSGPFDLVVANPPYIRSGDLAGLSREVRVHDPAAALDGGPDGLGAYRTIVADLARLLDIGGAAFLEIGYDQASQVSDLALDAGFQVTVTPDLAGRDRVVGLTVA